MIPLPPVVTLNGSYGAGSHRVGRRLAEALGVPFIDQLYTSEHLEALEEEVEGPGGLLTHLLTALGRTTSGLDNPPPTWFTSSDAERALENTAEVLRLTADGGVILGRSATTILAERPNTFHVRLDAPEAVRVARAAEAGGITVEAARTQLERDDRVRTEMSRRLYDWDPRRTDRYDLCLNTATFDLDTCVRLILATRTESLRG